MLPNKLNVSTPPASSRTITPPTPRTKWATSPIEVMHSQLKVIYNSQGGLPSLSISVHSPATQEDEASQLQELTNAKTILDANKIQHSARNIQYRCLGKSPEDAANGAVKQYRPYLQSNDSVKFENLHSHVQWDAKKIGTISPKAVNPLEDYEITIADNGRSIIVYGDAAKKAITALGIKGIDITPETHEKCR